MQARKCVRCDRPAEAGKERCFVHQTDHTSRKGWVVGVIVGVAIIGLAAYLGWPEPEPVTLEEYAAIVCNKDRPKADTWGEARASLRSELRDRESLIPPEEMTEWHEGKIEMLSITLDALSGLDADEPINELLLLGIPELRRAMVVDKAADRSLSLETHRQLRQHGCRV